MNYYEPTDQEIDAVFREYSYPGDCIDEMSREAFRLAARYVLARWGSTENEDLPENDDYEDHPSLTPEQRNPSLK